VGVGFDQGVQSIVEAAYDKVVEGNEE